MRLVHISGYYINPERVAFVRELPREHITDVGRTVVFFSGNEEDHILVNEYFGEVVAMLQEPLK